MAGRRKAPLWQRPFLRALGRSGNVEASAQAAGVDKSSVYLRKKAHADFAAKLDAAVAEGKASAAAGRRPPKRAPVELILQVGKQGPRFVRAAAGRWSAKAEARFLTMLTRTGCVRWAAAAAGLSVNALYYRRKHYPGFAADWDAAEAEAGRRISGFLTAATIATFDPEAAEDLAGEDLPKVTIAEGIQIARLKGLGAGRAADARGRGRPLPSIEQVRANILRKLDEIEAHEKQK